jgi:hypothetical protein
MIIIPNCWKRKCKHYQGVKYFGSEETTEDNFCLAFPKGIPTSIAYGKNKHTKPLPDQDNDIVFEKRKD